MGGLAAPVLCAIEEYSSNRMEMHARGAELERAERELEMRIGGSAWKLERIKFCMMEQRSNYVVGISKISLQRSK